MLDDTELVREAQRGHMASMEALFRRYADRAVKLAYIVTCDWPAAEDAAQEAFFRAFRSLDSVRPDAPFLPWFTTILLNEAKRSRRKSSRHMPLPQLGEGTSRVSSPEEATILRETRLAVKEALWTLDEKHRVPVALKYLLDLSEKEISAALGVPLTTIKSRLFVARKRLREALSEERGGDAGCARIVEKT